MEGVELWYSICQGALPLSLLCQDPAVYPVAKRRSGSIARYALA